LSKNKIITDSDERYTITPLIDPLMMCGFDNGNITLSNGKQVLNLKKEDLPRIIELCAIKLQQVEGI